MEALQLRNPLNLLYKFSTAQQQKKAAAMRTMKHINAYRFIIKEEESITIVHEQHSQDLINLYGQEVVKTQLVIPMGTVRILRKLFYIPQTCTDRYWLRELMGASGDYHNILKTIRKNRLDYRFLVST